MKPDCFFPREFIVELPDDDGASLAAIMKSGTCKGATVPWEEWLIRFSDDVMSVHFRLAFPDIKITADHHFIVADEDRGAAEVWIEENARGDAIWTHLEMILPWSLTALRDWAAAHHRVTGRRPRARSFALWGHRFGPNARL